jgi:hypothetical protein
MDQLRPPTVLASLASVPVLPACVVSPCSARCAIDRRRAGGGSGRNDVFLRELGNSTPCSAQASRIADRPTPYLRATSAGDFPALIAMRDQLPTFSLLFVCHGDLLSDPLYIAYNGT